MRINARCLLCIAAVLVVATVAHAQVPTSGARLDIVGTVGSTPVNRSIYDSQIHSGTVRSVGKQGNCTATDALVKTDAYVLQGGSATGCDPEGKFETGQGPGTATISAAGYSFTITTQYLSSKGKPLCTSLGVVPTVCTNPPITTETGFLTVTNNSGATFSGTITLNGTAVHAVLAGDPNCPTSGAVLGQATEVFTNGLKNSASVTLALSPDSSECGGFNADQSQTITAVTPTATFLFGEDKLTIAPANITFGDTLTFRPVPQPQGLFNKPGLTLTNSTFGNGQACVSIADFSANKNPVCPEFQTKCFNGGAACGDAETFLWSGEFDGRIDTNNPLYPHDPATGIPEIGNVHFLGAKGADCPTSSFGEDIIFSYIGDSPADLPLKSGGSGLNCFVTTSVIGANPIAPGIAVQAFVGYQTPVVDGQLNSVNAGRSEPLKFQQFIPGSVDQNGNPVAETNLNWCPKINANGTCAVPTLPNPGPGPWVFFAQIPIDCTTQQLISGGSESALPNSSNFQTTLSAQGIYQLNWQTSASQAGTCVTVVQQYDTGLIVFPGANFQFH